MDYENDLERLAYYKAKMDYYGAKLELEGSGLNKILNALGLNRWVEIDKLTVVFKGRLSDSDYKIKCKEIFDKVFLAEKLKNSTYKNLLDKQTKLEIERNKLILIKDKGSKIDRANNNWKVSKLNKEINSLIKDIGNFNVKFIKLEEKLKKELIKKGITID